MRLLGNGALGGLAALGQPYSRREDADQPVEMFDRVRKADLRDGEEEPSLMIIAGAEEDMFDHLGADAVLGRDIGAAVGFQRPHRPQQFAGTVMAAARVGPDRQAGEQATVQGETGVVQRIDQRQLGVMRPRIINWHAVAPWLDSVDH